MPYLVSASEIGVRDGHMTPFLEEEEEEVEDEQRQHHVEEEEEEEEEVKIKKKKFKKKCKRRQVMFSMNFIWNNTWVESTLTDPGSQIM